MTSPTVSRSKAKSALQALSRGKRDFPSLSPREIFPHGLFAFGDAKRDPDHDRETVISAVAGVEQALEEAILTRFTLRADSDDMLFLDPTPLVRDFYDKCRFAYLLGIIGEQTLHDLSVIRYVRNAFAHTRGHLDLDMPEFQNMLCHLTAPDRAADLIIKGHKKQDHRERFIQTCFQLAMYLAMGVDKEEPGKIMAQRLHVFQQ